MEREETPQTADSPDPLQRTADVLSGDDARSEQELRDAQDSLDSRLEREGADQSDVGR